MRLQRNVGQELAKQPLEIDKPGKDMKVTAHVRQDARGRAILIAMKGSGTCVSAALYSLLNS